MRPEVGEHVTSLDMAGLSLTVMFLDEELEQHWLAAADAPAFRRGGTVEGDLGTARTEIYTPGEDPIPEASAESRESAERIAGILADVETLLVELEPELGRMDAIAGDGDHGQGMVLGAKAARAAAERHRSRRRCPHRPRPGRRRLVRRGRRHLGRALGRGADQPGPRLRRRRRRLRGAAAHRARPGRRGGRAARRREARRHDHGRRGRALPRGVQPPPGHGRRGGGPGRLRLAHDRDSCGPRGRGRRATSDIAATMGRARNHGEKSVGTPDPGAISFSKIVTLLAEKLTA